MFVKDLIENLKKLDENLPIFINTLDMEKGYCLNEIILNNSKFVEIDKKCIDEFDGTIYNTKIKKISTNGVECLIIGS